MNIYRKKIIVGVILIGIFLGFFTTLVPFISKKAEAQFSFGCLSGLFGKLQGQVQGGLMQITGAFGSVPVYDRASVSLQSEVMKNTLATSKSAGSIETKERCLDGLAYLLINIIISQVADSLTAWINNGFQGSPGFITNPESFFTNVGIEASGAVINDLGLNFLCEPFAPSLQFKLNFGLDFKQYRKQKVLCTLPGILRNAQGFASYTQGQFDVAGMGGLLSISEPQNNPYGAFIYASAEVQAEGIRKKELAKIQSEWNKGFKSVTDSLNKIITPGAVVEKQINDSLASGKRRIEAADEINEIIGALLGQLLSTLTSGLSGGNDRSDDIAGYTPPFNPDASGVCPAGTVQDGFTKLCTTNLDPNKQEGVVDQQYPGVQPGTINASDQPSAIVTDSAVQTQSRILGLYQGVAIAKNGPIQGAECTRNTASAGPADMAIDGSSFTYSLACNQGTDNYWSLQMQVPNLIKSVKVLTYYSSSVSITITGKDINGASATQQCNAGGQAESTCELNKPLNIEHIEIKGHSGCTADGRYLLCIKDVTLYNYLKPVLVMPALTTISVDEDKQSQFLPWETKLKDGVTAKNINAQTETPVNNIELSVTNSAGDVVTNLANPLPKGLYTVKYVAVDSNGVKSDPSTRYLNILPVINTNTGGGGGGTTTTLSGSCVLTPSQIMSNEFATWTANVSTPTGSTYQWSGLPSGAPAGSAIGSYLRMSFTNSGTSNIEIAGPTVLVTNGSQTTGNLACPKLIVSPPSGVKPVALSQTVRMTINQSYADMYLSATGTNPPLRYILTSQPSGGGNVFVESPSGSGNYLPAPTGTVLPSNSLRYYPGVGLTENFNSSFLFKVKDNVNVDSDEVAITIIRP